ncbi:hypothetical protein EDD86DRAFT_214972, partial [Gorgonomyces haynaldii]
MLPLIALLTAVLASKDCIVSDNYHCSINGSTEDCISEPAMHCSDSDGEVIDVSSKVSYHRSTDDAVESTVGHLHSSTYGDLDIKQANSCKFSGKRQQCERTYADTDNVTCHQSMSRTCSVDPRRRDVTQDCTQVIDEVCSDGTRTHTTVSEHIGSQSNGNSGTVDYVLIKDATIGNGDFSVSHQQVNGHCSFSVSGSSSQFDCVESESQHF